MPAQQQSKQDQTTIASKISTTTTGSSTSKSVDTNQSSAKRRPETTNNRVAVDGNKAKIISDKNNASNMENKSSVDNFLAWLTSPLEIDVTGGTKQSQQQKKLSSKKPQAEHNQPSQKHPHQTKLQPQNSRQVVQQQTSPKMNATKTVKNNLPIKKQTKKVQTYHEQKMMQQKKELNKDATNNNNEHDQNPAEQFFNWLTSPPDLGQKDPLSTNKKQEQQPTKKHVIKPQPSDFKKQQNPVGKKPQQVHHKNQQKQFGENIAAAKKPDSIRLSELDINLNPHPELPSHVPTPATIDDIDELWTNKVEGVIDNALGGIHHHFTNIFADNNQGKNNNIKHYVTSFDTPPQSPVSTGKKSIRSKLVLTPPSASSSTKTSKWGPEIWNAKKSSPTNSVSMMSPPSISTKSLVSANSNSSIDSILVDGELLNIELSELANQEKLLRAAMERKQKSQQRQKYQATKKITATTATYVDGSGGDEPSSTINKNIEKEQPNGANGKKKKANRTSDSTKKKSSSTAHPSPTSITTPLQLRWMYENTLNLQSSCPRRGSIRRCDGEDLNSYSSSLYMPILIDEKTNVRSSLMKEQHPQHNFDIQQLPSPMINSSHAISA
jgi:hypothetical protein